MAFLAGAAFFAAFFFGAGPFARFSASISDACSSVSSSGVCPRRSDALTSPSVTYGPKRPSLITSGFSVSGSLPISRSGGAAARRWRVFGAASNASASSSVTVNILSSESSERNSSPRLTYGP